MLPGSRASELQDMLPVYKEFIKEHSQENNEYLYLIPAADKKLMEVLKKSFHESNLPVLIKENSMREFLSISELSIVTSGTASLESAVLGCPPIICYKTNFINYSIISRMLKVDNIGLPNLLLDNRYFVELLQNDFNKKNIKNAIKETLLLKENSETIAESLKEMLKGRGYSDAARELTLI